LLEQTELETKRAEFNELKTLNRKNSGNDQNVREMMKTIKLTIDQLEQSAGDLNSARIAAIRTFGNLVVRDESFPLVQEVDWNVWMPEQCVAKQNYLVGEYVLRHHRFVSQCLHLLFAKFGCKTRKCVLCFLICAFDR
jgi:hypothetical protein